MLMHMKPLYTVKKKIQKFFSAPLKKLLLTFFFTIKYNYYSIRWTISTSTFNMFKTNKFERILDEDP